MRWGTYGLVTRYLTAGQVFAIGEDQADFAVDGLRLGAQRVELVRVGEGEVLLTVPDGFSLQRTASPKGTPRERFVRLVVGEAASLTLGALTFDVQVERAEAVPRGRARRDWRLFASVAAAVVTCAVPLVAGALTLEEAGPGIDPARLALIRHYLGEDVGSPAARSPSAPGATPLSACCRRLLEREEAPDEIGRICDPTAVSRGAEVESPEGVDGIDFAQAYCQRP